MKNRIINILLLLTVLIALYLTYERFKEHDFEQKLKDAENRIESQEGRQYY